MRRVLCGESRFYAEHGDCLDAMRLLPSGAVDMVLCDLPYGTTCNAWDAVIPFDRLWPELLRVTKPSAAIVLFAQTPFDKVLGASRLDLLRYEWIWLKSVSTGFLNARRAPLKAHENVLVFYREAPTYNPQKVAGLPYKIKRHQSKSTNYKLVDDAAYLAESDGEQNPRDFLCFPQDRPRLHPTQKPVDLCRYLIRTYTNPSEIVLDPTYGSGSTGVAAIMEGRRFIGFEREDEYVKIARRRIASVDAVPTQASFPGAA